MSFIEELSNAANSYRKEDENERRGVEFFIETNAKRLKEETKTPTMQFEEISDDDLPFN